MAYGLTRRSLLRALGPAALALPALELTCERASAQEPPKRFVLMYAGMSASRGGGPGNLVVPTSAGRGYGLSRPLLSLGAGELPYGGSGYDVQNDVSVVSGLKIPWGTGLDIPPAGRSVHFHYNTSEPQTTGMRRGADRSNGPAATSADVLVGDALGGDTSHQSLSYRVQAARYITGGNATEGGLHALSLRRREDGSLQSIEAVTSPRLAYQSLFSGFVPENEGREEAILRLQQRRDILTAVHSRTSRVMSRLGTQDQRTVQRHLEELAALQNRLAMIPEPGVGSCAVPTSPGEDPPISDGHETFENGNLMYTPGRGWSQETQRGNAMVDMIQMAFACDLARSVGFRITLDQTFLNGDVPVGANSDMHELTHSGNTEGCADSLGWHVEFFSRLVRGLKDTPDVDGNPILDSTAIVLLFEGGFGFDPEGSADNSTHSTENMVALVGGGAGGLTPGVHVQTDEAHPAQVVASALEAVGLEDRLGEVEGRVAGLFG